MKKILLILTVISLNAILQSCTKESVASTDALYNTQASEDEEINQDPDEPDEPETPKNGE